MGITETKKDEMAQRLMTQGVKNSKCFNISVEKGLEMALKRLMEEYPVAALAFIS